MTDPSRSSVATSNRRARDLRVELAALGWPMIGLLGVQFLLGMGLNLFVSLPTGSPGAILGSSPILILHFVVAILLIGISARALVLALRQKGSRALAAGGLSLLSTLGATAAGVSFTFGPGGAVASFVMSAAFVGMLIGAGLLIGLAPDRNETLRAKAAGELGAGGTNV